MKVLFDANTPSPLGRFLRGHEEVRADHTGRKLGIVFLATNHWPTLRRVAARIATAVDFAQPGKVVRIDVAAL